MPKLSLAEAVQAAKSQRAESGLDDLVNMIHAKVMAGVASVIIRELDKRPDRTDEVLGAMAAQQPAMLEAIAKVAEMDMPQLDLTPVLEAIANIPQADAKPREWEFIHERNSRREIERTVARAID